jgi:RNA polymerase-interacting CarD/CdnL/TRCF family regulator
MSVDLTFDIGDWVVHNYYGVGQVKRIEKKPIHGEKVRTFRVKTKDSVYWIPVKKAENPRIRRVVDKRKLRRALRILSSKPEKMAKNYKTRNSHISEVFEDGSIREFMRLLRDLYALGETKKFNTTEKNAVDKLEERVAREYAACYEMSFEQAREKLEEKYLK